MFGLMRPNVLPLDDLGLLRGISLNYFSGEPELIQADPAQQAQVIQR